MADRIDILRWLNAASYRRVKDTDPVRPIVNALRRGYGLVWLLPWLPSAPSPAWPCPKGMNTMSELQRVLTLVRKLREEGVDIGLEPPIVHRIRASVYESCEIHAQSENAPNGVIQVPTVIFAIETNVPIDVRMVTSHRFLAHDGLIVGRHELPSACFIDRGHTFDVLLWSSSEVCGVHSDICISMPEMGRKCRTEALRDIRINFYGWEMPEHFRPSEVVLASLRAWVAGYQAGLVSREAATRIGLSQK